MRRFPPRINEHGPSAFAAPGESPIRRNALKRPALKLSACLCLLTLLGLIVPQADAKTIHVKTAGADGNDGLTWQTAKKTVTAGLTAAVSGDEVWVAAGTYVERIDLKDGVALYGGFAGGETELSQRNWTTNVTVLDGNKSGSVVMLYTGSMNTTRIDGFTITHGDAGFGDGGGIYCAHSSATFTNNTITENVAGFGGGIYCYRGSPTISNNLIIGNLARGSSGAGGGVYSGGGSPQIVNNTIMGNRAHPYTNDGYGGGICAGGSATISNNLIALNSAGEPALREYYSGHGGGLYGGGTIHNNTIVDNTALGLGGGISDADTIINNVVSGNTAGSYGGGIRGGRVISNNFITGNAAGQSGGGIYGGGAVISNNTLMGNSAGRGGGIGCEPAAVTISNNIVAFNSSGIYVLGGSGGAPTLRSNCVYNPDGPDYSGLSAGPQDISMDPQLLAIEYGRAHLRAGSPCIDAGDDGTIQAGSVDIDGEPRIQSSHTDIGADEFNGTAPSFTPSIVRVSPSGHDDNDGSSWALAKKTVQAGIDAARETGGEVWVGAGTYNESVTLRPWAHLFGGFAGTESTRSERMLGDHAAILDGSNNGSVVIAVGGYRVSRLDGFTVRNGAGTWFGRSLYGGGIFCNTSSPVISNNAIVNNTLYSTDGRSSYGAGMCCLGSAPAVANNVLAGNSAGSSVDALASGGAICCLSSFPTIINNRITGNSTSGNGGAIACTGHQPVISNNTITGSFATSGGGIWLLNSTAVLSNNIIAFNSSGIAWSSATIGTPVLQGNCVYNPGGTNYSGVGPGTADISVDPLLLTYHQGDVHLTRDSPCIDAGADTAVQAGWLDLDGQARIQGSHVDMGADEFNGNTPPYSPVVIRVSPFGNDANDGFSWVSSKRTVQAGIDAASGTGGEVWVAADTYNERIILTAGVYAYGGFNGTELNREEREWSRHLTILDGEQQGTVVTIRSGVASSGIDGFVIRNGFASIKDLSTRYGGGIFCYYSSPLISHNTIVGNRTDLLHYGYGGGISCYYASPTISQNAIMDNDAGSGGGIYCFRSSPMIDHNVISGNSARDPVSGGSGGGICASESTVIRNNTITGNIASRGGGIFGKADNIYNNVIAGNSATENGGGVSDVRSQMMANNTIVGNSAREGGGVHLSSGSSPTLVSNLVAFNSSGVHAANATPTLRFNCIHNPAGSNYTGVSPGTQDISVDPQLVSVAYGEFHLRESSPCIDAGDAAVVEDGSEDIDGEPRIQGSQVEIGADEFSGTTPAFTPNIVRVSPSGHDDNDGSSWALSKRTVQAGMDMIRMTGGEVWVAAGVYNERVVLRPWAYVYGGFTGIEDRREQRDWRSNATTLHGGSEGSVVSTIAGFHASSIDGFVIRGGSGTRIGPSRYGGGIYCLLASPTISNNIVAANTASLGGGMYCYYSHPVIAGIAFIGNTASSSGGGIANSFGSPNVAHCTFSSNAASSGLLLSNESGVLTLTNCILWANSASAIQLSTKIMHSCVQGGWNGLGNINSNPRFVRTPDPGSDSLWGTADDDLGDLRLQDASPCVDAGNNAAVPADALDLDGDGNTAEPIPLDLAHRLRLTDDPFTVDTGAGTPPIVDMGAYEFQVLPGDLNGDEYVDLDDLEIFAACATGPSMPYSGGLPSGCSLTVSPSGFIGADLDRDHDVDHVDFGIFQRCFSGPDNPPDSRCAD